MSSDISRSPRLAFTAPHSLDEDQASTVRTRFAQLLAESFRIVLPGAADYDTAAMFLRNHRTGLRAGDALHLAVAHHQQIRMLYSLDAQLVGAARALGIRATDELKRPKA